MLKEAGQLNFQLIESKSDIILEDIACEILSNDDNLVCHKSIYSMINSLQDY